MIIQAYCINTYACGGVLSILFDYYAVGGGRGRCSDPGRRKMLVYSTNLIVDWMKSTRVPSEPVQMVEKYILAQDRLSWQDCLPPNPSTMLETLAEVQDRLGWDNFIEGRISKVFLSYVQPHLNGRRRRLSPRRWGTTFITHIISLTHKQWLFRNSHVHFKKLEGLTPAQHDEIFKRVQTLMWTDPADLLDRHKYLLEEDFH